MPIAATSAVFIIMFIAAGVVAHRYLRRMAQAQQEISEAKATADQALESMDNGFLLLDANHCILRWNRRYLELYPWQRERVAVGVPFASVRRGCDWLSPETIVMVFCASAAALQQRLEANATSTARVRGTTKSCVREASNGGAFGRDA